MQIRKIVKLKINNENLEELEKLLAIWRYSVIQKRKEININNPSILTTYKNSLKQFNNFLITLRFQCFIQLLSIQDFR
jgi:hypothetical protein